MRQIIYSIAIMASVIGSSASAQNAPAAPAFVPFTVDENAARGFIQWLDEQPIPRKYSQQIASWFAQMEQRAATAARAKPNQETPEPEK